MICNRKLICRHISIVQWYIYIFFSICQFHFEFLALILIGWFVRSFSQGYYLTHLILQVTTPLLKFMAEFVLNKAQRLTFDSSSPNGILLFREVSKLVVAYGSRILSLPNVADLYAFKYKGIWISLTIISRGKNINRYLLYLLGSFVHCDVAV